MKKQIVFSVMFLFLVTSVLALTPAAYNGLNKKGTQHLYLFEKDSSWNIVEDGAWGKLSFKDTFVFNGHNLVEGQEYVLLNNAEWGVPADCLATGIANEEGNLHLSGSGELEGKIWLVLGSDVDCESTITGWNPTEYLFEYNLL